MPIKVTCSSCSASLRAPDTAAGKRIKCPKCSAVLPVPKPAAPPETDLDTLPAGPPASAKSTVRTRRQEVQEEPPVARQEDKRPRSRPARQTAVAANNHLGLWLAIGGVGVGLVAIILVVAFLFLRTPEAVVNAGKKSDTTPVMKPPPPGKTEQPEEEALKEPQKQPKGPKPGNIQFPVWRTQSSQKLSQLAKAMHNFHSTHNAFPYAKSGAGSSKGQLSWRVAILPFLGQEGLYRKFNFQEPWDSPHNKRILDEEGMPTIFISPSSDNPDRENKTYYQIITGPQTGWPNDNMRPKLPGSYPLGTSNKFLIVEANTPVYWTQPEDVVFDGTNVPPLGGIFNGDFHAAMVDASVQFFQRGETTDDDIRSMVSVTGG
jgi:Protein of unknown function (DUF1559)